MKIDYDARVIRQYLFWIQVCSKLDPEETVKTINNVKPCAETGQWKIAPEYLMLDPNPNQCDESPEHKHYILIMDGVYDEPSKPESGDESTPLSGLPEKH